MQAPTMITTANTLRSNANDLVAMARDLRDRSISTAAAMRRAADCLEKFDPARALRTARSFATIVNP